MSNNGVPGSTFPRRSSLVNDDRYGEDKNRARSGGLTRGRTSPGGLDLGLPPCPTGRSEPYHMPDQVLSLLLVGHGRPESDPG